MIQFLLFTIMHCCKAAEEYQNRARGENENLQKYKILCHWWCRQDLNYLSGTKHEPIQSLKLHPEDKYQHNILISSLQHILHKKWLNKTEYYGFTDTVRQLIWEQLGEANGSGLGALPDEFDGFWQHISKGGAVHDGIFPFTVLNDIISQIEEIEPVGWIS